jgi:hypothetical protein
METLSSLVGVRGREQAPKSRQKPLVLRVDFLIVKVRDGDHSFVTAKNISPSSLPINPHRLAFRPF